MVKTLRDKVPRYLVPSVVALIVVSGLLLFFLRRDDPVVTTTPKATIHQLAKKSAANNGEKHSNASSPVNQGTSTDNHGTQTATDTSPGQWTKSQSGVITVKQPVSGSTVKSGDILSGSASIDKIQYRLIDDQVGVISQGFISVINGSFSASISFPSNGTSGRLDVFSSNSNGAEINEVQIPVKFGG